MKSITACLLGVLCLYTNAFAQTFVTIPDTAFVTYLQTYYGGCMSGNQMDITCAGITTTPAINVSNRNIADLTGVQYMTSLQLLNCESNQLTSLPPLPSGLVTLQAGINQITTLPTLPAGLTTLRVEFNPLTAIPTLPANLEELVVGGIRITNFPALPATLLRLDVQTCGLSVLPALPAGLKNLICANDTLGTLPSLPPTLEMLIAFNCGLTSLPPLPSTLLNVDVWQNSLTALPSPLPVGLMALACGANQLTALPALPSTLSILDAHINQISALPALPLGMTSIDMTYNQLTTASNLPPNAFYCNLSHNQITCFGPFLQPSTLNLNADGNPFTCIPNYPNYMTPILGSIPICTPGNVFGCVNGEGVGGSVFDDLNADCILNGSDPGIVNVPVRVFDGSGTFVQGGSSHDGGPYFYSQGVGNWTLRVDTVQKPYRVTCSYPGLDSTVALSVGTPLVQGVNFEVDCKPGFDVGTLGVGVNGILFPGQPFSGQILAGDMSNFYGLHCATGVAGQVSVTVNGPVTYTGNVSGTLAPVVAGNTYTYAIADFGLVSFYGNFGLTFTTQTTAQAGDTVSFDISVSPGSGDMDPANNTYHIDFLVTNSFDPNAKDVYPTEVAPNYDGWLNYTVHFQNTGNAAAINIRVEDTLDANLDWQTLELLAASHYETWTVTGNQLAVHFPNIHLPDSTTDPNGSMGWFNYRVKPKQNLPLGTVIPNSAAIYFDFNAPVITNTATTTYNSVTAVKEVAEVNPLAVYPNPSEGHFQVEYPMHWKHVEWTVTNLMGQALRHDSATGGAFAVDLSGQPAGFYLLKVSDASHQVTRQIIKR